MNTDYVQEGMNAYYSRDPEALKRVLEQLVKQAQKEGKSAPETN